MYVFMEQFERRGHPPGHAVTSNQRHSLTEHHHHHFHRSKPEPYVASKFHAPSPKTSPMPQAATGISRSRQIFPDLGINTSKALSQIPVRRRQSSAAPSHRNASNSKRASVLAEDTRKLTHLPQTANNSIPNLPPPVSFFSADSGSMGALSRRESVIYGSPKSPLHSPYLLSRRPSGTNCYSVPASPSMGGRKTGLATAPVPTTPVTPRSPPPRSVARGGVRQAMLRSKSQSRTALKEDAVYDVIPHQKLKNLTTDVSPPKKRQSINERKSASSTPSSQRKAMSTSIQNIYKLRPRLPLSTDASIILEVFDPDKNDRRRAATEKTAMTASRDKIGFDLVQQELRAFSLVKNLCLGKFRRIQVSDLLGIEQWHSNLIMKKHQMTNLQRPQRKSLQEYYNDDDAQLEALTKLVDPHAPRPSGQMITPVRGDFPVAMAPNGTRTTASAKSFETILERHAQIQPKVNCATVIDHAGKLSTSLTYAKLHTRAIKIAHMLLHKTVNVQIPNSGKEKRPICLPGDRVALVYPNTEPVAFLSAFYGCILAGMVPVPVEVPITRRDAGIQQFGFLLGSCGARIALTSESCLKGLPKAGSQTPTSSSSNSTNSPSNPGTYHHSTNGSTGSGEPSHLPPSSGPHGPNDVADFKGWPRLQWVVTEHLSKPNKDWKPPPAVTNGEIAYVEYVTDREGSVKGVCVTREAMLAHCRAIVAAMGYKENECMVTVLDFKRDVGLWHAILAGIYAGMRVIFVPYSVMKVNPTSWMFHASKLQATAALVKSRDLHWSVMATPRDPTGQLLPPNNAAPMSLSTLRCVVVADGANPWSLSPCDQFAATFHSRGLRPDAICPVAGSPETGSLCLRRPTETGGGNSGRGTLSMSALSFNVVRVDQENSLTSLTVQDSGQIVPGGLAVVIKPTGPPKLCKTDEIGEICLHAPSTASRYYGLKGITTQNFQVQPCNDDKPLGPANYVRSGLIGFMTPEGLAFVIGNKNSMMSVSGRQHSADDIIATVLAVDSMKFIYRGRIAVFSVRVLRDERVCVVAEQKVDVAEEDAFNWMLRVIQAVNGIHGLDLYCIALVPANALPKTPLGGLHVSETRQRFLDGCLHPSTLLMCPQSSVMNLPEPRQPRRNDVGAAFMMVGNLIQGARIASASGRELTMTPEEPINFIDILRQRSQQTPDHVLFTLVNSKGAETDNLSCAQLLKKAERIGALLLDKGHLNAGDHVALIFPPGLELITAFYGCLAAGLVPVCIRPPAASNLAATLVTVRMVVDVSNSVALLSTSAIIKLLKCKEASHRVNAKAWPTILDVEDMPSSSVARRRNVIDQNERKPTDTLYLDFAVSTTGQLAGIVVTALSAATQAKSLKVACELYPSRHVVLSLDPYSGLGFSLWTLSSVYAGHHSILIPPNEIESNPSLWLSIVSQHKVRDTFCSYSVMENCVRELASQVVTLKEKGINLSCLRTCVAIAEERPRVSLCNAFSKLFAPLGLNSRVVSTSFGSRVNTAICMQGAASPDPSVVYVDAWALRNDRITMVEKGAPHSLALMESGKLLPGVKVVIANPDTKGQCADSHLGEIWVASQHNAAGYFSIFGEEAHLHTDHFTAKLQFGDTHTLFARTGYLGFLRQTESITADGELHDAVFVVGAIDETMMLRGMRYHPIDLETSVIRAHRKIVESAVFTWTSLLVVVAETAAPEAEALDLVPAITSALLEDHHLTVGVVVLVDPFTIPINSRGEKQRMHLRDAFVKDQLDPLYVAYNM